MAHPKARRRILWRNPDSNEEQTYATIPMNASDEAQRVALDACKSSVARLYGPQRAMYVHYEPVAGQPLDDRQNMIDAHAEGFHADDPREFCPECESQRG